MRKFDVWVARDGGQALSVADELSFNADVLVLDLDLGPGLNGAQFVAAYRRRAARRVPIVVMSGRPRAPEIARAIGAATHVAKPFVTDQLIRAVRLLAGRPGGPSTGQP